MSTSSHPPLYSMQWSLEQLDGIAAHSCVFCLAALLSAVLLSSLRIVLVASSVPTNHSNLVGEPPLLILLTSLQVAQELVWVAM